jgi:hypothetical protein
MSGALGLLGRSAAIHHRRVLLDSAGSPCASTYSPLALDTRAPGIAGICPPPARSGPHLAAAHDPGPYRHSRRVPDRRAGHGACGGRCATPLLRNSLSVGKEAPDNTPRTPIPRYR